MYLCNFCVVPDPPAFVKVIGNTSTTITLQWSSPQSSLGNIQRYIIEYNGTFDDSITIIIVRGQQFSEVATGLHPFSEYDFKVYAETTKGRSTARNISAKTLEDGMSEFLHGNEVALCCPLITNWCA